LEKNIINFYKKKKILITGATGFKGSWLCSWLNILGSKVYAVGHSPNKNKKLFYSLKLDKKTNLKILDVRNKKKLETLIKKVKPEIIFHMAAQPLIYESYIKPYLTYEVNTLGTLNILEIVKKVNFVKSLICVTSDKCYENNFSTRGFKETDKLGGDDPYSGSKACAEIIVKTYFKSFFSKKKLSKIGIASARAGNVIGGGDFSSNRLIPDTVAAILKNKTIYLRNPGFNRPWQHVLESLNGYLILAQKMYYEPQKYSGPWNFGISRKSITSVLNIVNKIIQFWGKGKIKYFKKQKFYEQQNLQLNIQKSKKFLNWKPKYSVSDSVETTTEWYKKVLAEKYCPIEITNEQIKNYMQKK